jgi:capsular polysaccharide transport system permease protein
MTTVDEGFDPNRGTAAALGKEVGNRLLNVGRSRPFLLYVIVVSVLAGIYFAFIAAPVYVSESSFTVRGRSAAPSAGSAGSLLSAVVGGGGGGGMAETLSEPAEIVDYIQSPQMMAVLDKRYGLHDLYSAPRADLLNWMPKDASRERFLKFYRKMILPSIDRESFIIRLEVRSFTARSAHDIASGVLDLTNDYVNNLSAKIRSDTLRSAQTEVTKAEEEVRSTRLNMTRYRSTNGIVDPSLAAQAQQGVISGLSQQLNQAHADRASLAAYSTPNAPLVRQIDARIKILEGQLALEQSKLAGNQHNNTVAQKLYGYEGLQVANDYAEKKLAAALQNYDSARVTASQRERYLVRAVNPSFPDQPMLPRRILNFFETVFVAIAAYAIVALAIAGVRDHQGL